MVDQGLYIGINGWWATLALLCHSSWTVIIILTMAGHNCNPHSNEVAKCNLCAHKKFIFIKLIGSVCVVWGEGVIFGELEHTGSVSVTEQFKRLIGVSEGQTESACLHRLYF